MYNSLVVSIFVKVWEAILHGYEGSFIKKTVDLIKRFIAYLANGSISVGLFTSNKSLIEKSIFYRMIIKATNLITLTFEYINKYIKKIGQNSVSYRSVNNLFSSKVEVLRSFFVFIFFFGIGLIGNNVIRGFFSGRSYIIAMILIIGALIGLAFKENYEKIISNSWFSRFVVSIFTIDEGGGNWW